MLANGEAWRAGEEVLLFLAISARPPVKITMKPVSIEAKKSDSILYIITVLFWGRSDEIS